MKLVRALGSSDRFVLSSVMLSDIASLSARKAFIRLGKETVQRRTTLKLLEEEIDALYKDAGVIYPFLFLVSF